MSLRYVALCAALAALAGCGTPAPRSNAPAGGNAGAASSANTNQRAMDWVEPYLFQVRNTVGVGPLAPSGNGKFLVESQTAPEIAKVVAAELAAAGFPIARDGEAGAPLSLTAKITIAPPDNYDPRNIVDFLPITEQALKTGRSLTAEANSSAGLRQLVIPLGGYRTSFGSTGASQASVYFVLANLLGATGARERFNSLFGADATGTVCFRVPGVNDLICDRKKGPLAEVTLSLSSGTGASRTITTTHSLIQLSANPMQALTYAVTDIRDAALGRPTPVCNYKTSKTREPGCNVAPITTASANLK